jgi:catechol 2,3-dioxygenase-like lactoylglutathione lyase family enzyme
MQFPVFDHYTIKVSELSKSVTFYQQILELPAITNRTEKAHIRWFSLQCGELHLVEGETKDIKTNVGVHLAIKISDFDAFMEHLKMNHITPHDSKGNPNSYTTRTDGVSQVYIQDPDQYWIEINNAQMQAE